MFEKVSAISIALLTFELYTDIPLSACHWYYRRTKFPVNVRIRRSDE